MCFSFACKKQADPTRFSPENASARIENALGGAEEFHVADEDFLQINLGSKEGVIFEKVLFGNGDSLREIGIFQLDSPAAANNMKVQITRYLEREAEAHASLAALYPSSESNRKAMLYKNATVGAHGALVWYFVLDEADTERAQNALFEK